MINFPNAKINLGLNIIEKRNDGFHNIETFFYPVHLYDVLEVVENKERKSGLRLSSSGNIIPGSITDNLCIKVYDLLSKHHQLPPVNIHLHKIIPTGAGLGGGSADAAFFIKLLDQKFLLKLSDNEMRKYASQLGSDCAFFIENKPCFASGKGDVLEEISFSLIGYTLVIVCPPVHVSTAEAYSGVIPKKSDVDMKSLLSVLYIKEWKENLKNDFEVSVFKKYPQIEPIKNNLYDAGAVYASLSGSGSAVYGLFESKPDLNNLFPGCGVWIKRLL